MNSLKIFLRQQYIGAIVIGMVTYQGLAALVGVVLAPVYAVVGKIGGQRPLMERSESLVDWNQLFPKLIYGVISLAIAYALMRWLYQSELLATEPLPASASDEEL